MDTQELIAKLFDEKKLKILRFFFDNPEDDFYIREISKKTRIPVATTFRIINKLRDLDIIRIKRMKKFKVYFLNRTKEVELLQDIVVQKKSALNEFVEKAGIIDEIEQIILHGKEEQEKANVLLVGHNIPVEKVKTIVIEIKEAFNFNIIDLSIEPDQFTKMSDMGLFPGRRTILFQK
ncbi:MAG: winged helix-turn-helix domain-containing protein [archaeon]